MCKNLVLAGVSVIIQDDAMVTEKDAGGANFFLKSEDVGKHVGPLVYRSTIAIRSDVYAFTGRFETQRVVAAMPRIQELNPFVNVRCISKPLNDHDDAFFEQFHVISLNGGSLEVQKRVGNVCHRKGIAFYVSENAGLHGVILADLNGHEYVRVAQGGTVISKNGPTKLTCSSFDSIVSTNKWGDIHKRLRWGLPAQLLASLVSKLAHDVSDESLENDQTQAFVARTLKEKGIEDQSVLSATSTLVQQMLDQKGADFSPICAVMGGILAQDVVKVVSGHNEPINSVFTFNGTTGEGRVTRVVVPSVIES